MSTKKLYLNYSRGDKSIINMFKRTIMQLDGFIELLGFIEFVGLQELISHSATRTADKKDPPEIRRASG